MNEFIVISKSYLGAAFIAVVLYTTSWNIEPHYKKNRLYLRLYLSIVEFKGGGEFINAIIGIGKLIKLHNILMHIFVERLRMNFFSWWR